MHYDSTLNSGPGFSVPVDGIYAFPIELTLVQGGITTHATEPLWIVMNNHLSEAQHDAAMAAVPVPEPATWMLLLGGSAALATCHRRRVSRG
jgi:hypothetical protein